jgi:hypothetical protein
MRVISVNTDITGIAAVLVSGVFHAAAKKVMVDMAKRPAALDHANRMDWVERVTTFCTEQWGLPPITGRILGWLMICDPAEQSAGQIDEAIGASRASLTANIRQLTAAVCAAAIPARRAHHVLLDRRRRVGTGTAQPLCEHGSVQEHRSGWQGTHRTKIRTSRENAVRL